MSGLPSPTKYDAPLRRLAREAFTKRVRQIAFSDWSTLFLTAPGREDEVVSRVVELLEEEGRKTVVVSAPGGPKEALTALGRALLGYHGRSWEDHYRELTPGKPEYMDILFSLQRGLDGTRIEPPQQGPLFVVRDLEPESASMIFARGRDEAWGFAVKMIVVAPEADKDSYLLTYSDSYFLDQHFAVDLD